MSNLTKEKRDALPSEHFAVPGKRKLPINDETHTRLAWDMVDRAKDLTPAERKMAKDRILKRAKELGIDVSNWTITASLSFRLDAMALEMPDMTHPNRMPFSGVLTRVDQVSDAPPHGSDGKRTLIPSEVAEAAIPSLMGMGVDFTPELNGHDAQSKIGLITEANIDGDALNITGFFYAADFPKECARIQAEKDALGFSYECQARIRDLSADIWEVEYCIFTGAAVLYKDLAAYQTTSLQATANNSPEYTMKPEELKALMDTLAGLQAGVAALTKDVTEIKASAPQKLDAGAALDKVKPHAEKLRACAASMEAAGIGNHATQGHVNVLRHMAASMEAEATMGNLPHIYRDHDYLSRTMEAGAVIKPVVDDKVTKQLETLSASIADLGTKFTDLQAKAFENSAAPERVTLTPEIRTLLAKAGITEDDASNGSMDTATVDKFLDAAGISGAKAVEAKLKLRHAGVMKAGR